MDLWSYVWEEVEEVKTTIRIDIDIEIIWTLNNFQWRDHFSLDSNSSPGHEKDLWFDATKTLPFSLNSPSNLS
jgi:hypothetical protein